MPGRRCLDDDAWTTKNDGFRRPGFLHGRRWAAGGCENQLFSDFAPTCRRFSRKTGATQSEGVRICEKLHFRTMPLEHQILTSYLIYSISIYPVPSSSFRPIGRPVLVTVGMIDRKLVYFFLNYARVHPNRILSDRPIRCENPGFSLIAPSEGTEIY